MAKQNFVKLPFLIYIYILLLFLFFLRGYLCSINSGGTTINGDATAGMTDCNSKGANCAQFLSTPLASPEQYITFPNS